MDNDIVKYLRLSRNRFNRNAEAADEIERLTINQDMWKRTCAKLVGMMLPYSLLMTESEREELKIILNEASNG
jgi:hypothetical protein